MSEIDWNENAKSAVREFADYIGQSDKCERYLKAFVTKKTVADAVEYYNSNFPEGYGILGIAYSNNKITPYYSGSPIADGTCSPESYIICTRAEFEAYVKEQEAKKKYPPLTQSLIDEAEQEADKWTHEYHGDNCKIVHQEKWQAWVISENGLSKLVPISELRKPKPALTKEQAWDYAVASGLTAKEIEKTHTVV